MAMLCVPNISLGTIGLMILVSHYAQRFANFLGSNRVAVLATLIMGLSSAHCSLQSVFHLDIQCTEEGCAWVHNAKIGNTYTPPPSCSACFCVSVALASFWPY